MTDRAVLTPGDISLLGIYRFPEQNWNLYYGAGPLALRRRGDQAVLYTHTIDGEPLAHKLVEYAIPAAPPTMSLATAPQLGFPVTYGNIWTKAFATAGITGADSFTSIVVGGLLWDERRHGLWQTWGDPYGVANTHHPTLGFTQFNDAGVEAILGPWRQSAPPNSTRGALVAIPSTFSQAHLAGQRFGVASGSASGIASCPAGCNLAAIEDIDPFTTPGVAAGPSPPYDPANAHAKNHWILLHDNAHPQPRDTRYKGCYWWMLGDSNTQNYDCRLNNHIVPGPPVWGGRINNLVNEDDSIGGVAWIETAVKEGLLFHGQLTTTPAGYRAPGDPDGLVHMWYGDPNHGSNSGSGYENGKCCHGQSDPFWGATGGASHYRVPHRWIYAIQELIASATGQAELWSRTPASITQFCDAQGNIALPGVTVNQMSSGFFRSPAFDPVTRRIYAICDDVDTLSGWGAVKQPVLLVFQVLDEAGPIDPPTEPPIEPGIDTEPPHVAIVSVTRGTEDLYTVVAVAFDTVGVTRVEFVVGDELKATLTSPPYSAAVHMPAGQDTITVRAFDAAGNTSEASWTLN